MNVKVCDAKENIEKLDNEIKDIKLLTEIMKQNNDKQTQMIENINNSFKKVKYLIISMIFLFFIIFISIIIILLSRNNSHKDNKCLKTNGVIVESNTLDNESSININSDKNKDNDNKDNKK